MGEDGIRGHLQPKLDEIRARREDIVDRRASIILSLNVFIILNKSSKERKRRSWKRLRKQEVLKKILGKIEKGSSSDQLYASV